MATFDNRHIIDAIIAAKGRQYDDEPPVLKIVEYKNAWGRIAWGVVWQGESYPDRYEHESQFIHAPRVIFQLEE